MTTSLPSPQPRFVPTAPSPCQSLSRFHSWSHFPRVIDAGFQRIPPPTHIYATHSICQSLRRTSCPKWKKKKSEIRQGALTQITPQGLMIEGCPSAALWNRFQSLSFLRTTISRWRLSVWSSEKHLEMSGFIFSYTVIYWKECQIGFEPRSLLTRCSDMLRRMWREREYWR